MKLNTFSIIARCPDTGNFGGAVATCFPGVGAYSPHIEPNVGAVVTQGWVNPPLGQEGLDHLKQGRTANETLNHLLLDDPGKELRQVSVMDSYGNCAAYTGVENDGYKGHRIGDQYSIQGNLLTGPEVIDDMAAAFENSSGPLAERLLTALEAADAAGGDVRGKQSSAVKVVAVDQYPFVDFRVDDHEEPVRELRRIYEKNKSVLIERYYEWIDAVKEGTVF
ncbi:DUF1028 domain-containing protein [Halobacillus mangrovi]|uniref:Fimbrial assembly protein FimA n=1 Tax=Halobacillus mangrovi TaxID=402384 RepID=A0A1W5ZT36_9BACI|nr:DUF1028 domain-containing protein [Halobacillus mangrovi]ARI76435.1 hypothetical protein HM131_06110 [Halobacillus mangrovi]